MDGLVNGWWVLVVVVDFFLRCFFLFVVAVDGGYNVRWWLVGGWFVRTRLFLCLPALCWIAATNDFDTQ